MTRPRTKTKTGTGLSVQDGSSAMQQEGRAKKKAPAGCRGRLLRNGDYDIRLFERLRHHRLLVMPEASSKSDRRHRDDDGQSEKCPHC